MIPDDITRLLHDIRLIGGGIKTYENPDDWVLIRNLIGDRYDIDLKDATPEFWDTIKKEMEAEKDKVQEKMDARYFNGLNHYNPFE